MSKAKYYINFKKYYVALDCVIFGFTGENLETILIKRNFQPGLGAWALPGGFIEPKESLDKASERILTTLTGLSDIYMEQFYTFGEVNRDPGARIISVGYYALIKIDDYGKELVSKHNAFRRKITNIPKLMFDHNIIFEKALEQLRIKVKNRPIGLELLPEKFTLPQLQKLYESIYLTKLDKRNFRKKILAMDIFEKQKEKDKESSKRGAFFYKFNKQEYNKLVAKGYNFEL